MASRRIVSMFVGREGVGGVDGRSVLLTGGPSPTSPGIPCVRFARSRPFRGAKGAVDSRLRGNDGAPGNEVRGIGYRAWDFWVRRSWMLWVLAAVVLLLDQSSKSLIVAWLDWGESWPAEGFLRFTHARNTGTAFSLFQGHSNILSIVAVFAVGILLWVYATTGARSFVLRLALGLQLGGALGNLLDRLQQGYVTDFIDVGWWPIFNVADSAISIGIVLMVWYFLTARDEESAAIATPVAAEGVGGGCQRCAEAMRYGTVLGSDS